MWEQVARVGGGMSNEYKSKLQGYRVLLRKLRSRRDTQGIQRYNVTRWEYLKLLEQQEIYWKQRSKQFWLHEGDKNTRFFHSYASTRRKNNRIERIKDDSGGWRETPAEIQDVIEGYFTRLFTVSNLDGRMSDREVVNRVSELDNDNLLAAVTKEEVKQAVFDMHPDKASGPDGLNPAFFQAFWSIVETYVVRFCHVFLSTGVLPEGVNEALVCLIPKIKVPQTMRDLRPISLCNVLVRILSKVVTNRLKPCLKNIISENQSAFIEGRLLTDNALIAFEVNHYIKRRTQGNKGIAGLKLDVSKAYDRLEWGFIRNMMEKFGFHQDWIHRVMTFIGSISYSFLHNGEQFGYVVPSRGVRQGDPISPYIYIMCVEGLSAIIRINEEDGLLHGCRIAKGAPVISHLLFADDCYLFFRATGSEANVMKRILDRYAEVSGQIINYNKSAITFSPNTSQVDRVEVCEQLRVQVNDQPGKYLGMPMHIGRRKKNQFLLFWWTEWRRSYRHGVCKTYQKLERLLF